MSSCKKKNGVISILLIIYAMRKDIILNSMHIIHDFISSNLRLVKAYSRFQRYRSVQKILNLKESKSLVPC